VTDGTTVEFQSLGHRFGDVEVLRNLSATVAAGDVACLVGPNGSGKTTLLRIVAGLLEPAAGEVVLGDAVGSTERRVGYLPQQPAFRPTFTVRETLSFYASLVPDETDVAERLEAVGLGDVADRRVDALSGGMIRLLGIAQTVIGEPPLLVLDEPASGLDPTMARHVTDTIDDLAAAGGTVLVATHDLAAVERVADEVLVLDRGTIVASGRPAALLEQTGTDSLADAFDVLTASDVPAVSAGLDGESTSPGGTDR
jgi:ABC-2 type transport system ATP-binding protein